jgi:hypothetical protein
MLPIYGGFNTSNTEKKPKPLISFSKNLGDFVSGTLNTAKNTWDYATNVGKQILTPEEKIQVEKKLKELLDTNQISQEAYAHSVVQINKKDGVLGMKDSIVSMLAPIQSVIKVIGDQTIPMPSDVYPPRKTLVKLIWFPKMHKQFVKGSLPEKNRKDIEMDEFMVVVKDSFSNPFDKFISDLNSVDNLLANVLNGCVGAGCKDGIISPEPVLEKTIEITDNIKRKEVLNQIKRSYEEDGIR